MSKIAWVALLGAMLGSAVPAAARSHSQLTLESSDSGIRGRARVNLRDSSKGTFDLRVQGLAPATAYDLVVGGIKVATLQTRSSGSARVRFSTRSRGKDLLLGFDPRGQAIEVRDNNGTTLLVGSMPLTTPSDDGDITCCIPDDSGPECEDRTPSECVAQGGTVMAAGSCLPDPCGAAVPTDVDVVCCLPDDSGPECEDRTQAECVAGGGVIVEASSCAANPCAATQPSSDSHIQCCVPAYYVWDCEDRTIAECQTLGGVNKGVGQCTTNPCGDLPPSDGHGICCLPNATGDEIECEDRTASACVAAGGVVKGASGTCDATTCADVMPPNAAVRCCLPNAAGDEIECEDRSEADCSVAGGISKGPGLCGLDTCADVLPPNPDIMCCLPGGGESECEDRTAEACAAAGGIDKGTGVCALDTCDTLPEAEVICCVPDSHGVFECEDRSAAECTARGGSNLGEGSCPAVDPCH